MGYVAAKGGFDAIRAAEDLTERSRLEGRSPWLELDQITERLRYAIDRVMGEGGLWDENLAARAYRQAEGDLIEATHLVRAHRSTLPRFGYTTTVDADSIDVLRRIVPAFREPPGPQLLGRTLDYTGRLLDLRDEDEARTASTTAAMERSERAQREAGQGDAADTTATADQPATKADATDEAPRVPGRLIDALRSMNLLVDRRRDDDPEPADITRTPARPGAPRSAALSSMARAETGALVQLWYRNIMGPDRHLHEVTLGEVRHGRLPVTVRHPYAGADEPNTTIGHVRVTEVEAIEDLDGTEEDRTKFDVGYGLVMGHNERKAIAMANLDIALYRDSGDSPLEQSILMTTDGLDAAGFLEHLKLPHYVTFRSMVERKKAMRQQEARRIEGGFDDDAIECVEVQP